MPLQTIGLIIGAVAVLVLVVGVVSSVRSRGSVEQRLQTFAGSGEVQIEEKKESKKRSTPIADSLNRALEGRKVSENLSTQLARADLKLTVGEFLSLQLIAALGIGAIGYLLSGTIVLGILAAVLGWFAPRWFVSWRQGQRLHAFNDQLGDALNLMVNGLRSGYSVMQAMEAVSREMPPPIAQEFSRIVQEVQIGLPLDQAMANMLRRIKSDDLDLVVTAINVQREVGGNLAEILDVISFTIRERVRIKGEIRTLTAQGRYSGYVISLLPIGLALVLFCVNKPYVERLFTSDWCGWAMVVCGLLMIGTGFIAIQKIVSIEV
ncbi:MAG TPA: type II secretion system F family protein [Anaerolineae bacterium]|nr:type II secretion system F family protein [Anaerolineae bacterium]